MATKFVVTACGVVFALAHNTCEEGQWPKVNSLLQRKPVTLARSNSSKLQARQEDAHAKSLEESLLPPRCLIDVQDPENDAYLQNIVKVEGRAVTAFSNNCTKEISNMDLITSMRNTLAATKGLLEKVGVPYVLFAGTSLGMQRCGDVIPYDRDTDMLIKDTDRDRLKELMNEMYDRTESCKDYHIDCSGHHWCPVGGRALDLGNYGIPGYYLAEKAISFLPFAVIDTATGLHTDIFVAKSKASTLLFKSSWWQNGGIMAEMDASGIFPGVKCEFGGIPGFTCASNTEEFLYKQYGEKWNIPDVRTRQL